MDSDMLSLSDEDMDFENVKYTRKRDPTEKDKRASKLSVRGRTLRASRK